MLALSLLGPLAISFNKRPFSQLTSQKAQALLIYLAVEKEQVHQRDSLMTLFWPDYPQKSAQSSLRQTIYRLRQAIEPGKTELPFILTDRFTVSWNPEAALHLDVTQFETLTGNGRSPQAWQQAIDLYRGDFLADFFLPDCDPFEQWAADKRAYYQRQAQTVSQQLVNHYLEVGDWDAAETAVRRQLTLDNLQEAAHRQLIEILAKNGRRQEALAQFETVKQLLDEELAIAPEAQTIALVESIRNGEFVDGTTSQTTESAWPQLNVQQSNPPKTNLPALLTTVIGREQERDETTELLTQHRLVTLLGTGGIGKTTLSLQIGLQLLGDYPDGVWFVELAPLTDPHLVTQEVASAMGITIQAHRSLTEHLQSVLQARTTLILLDNCEHLLDACAHLADALLRHCPNITILATSREPLGVPGEALYDLPPLAFPALSTNEAITTLTAYPAMQLFAERARLVQSHFMIDEAKTPFIMQICRQLDGLPLAIELAAARVNVLSVQEIATRLQENFHLLTQGSRTVLPRHKTMRALIDWSHNLLTESEQRILHRLSVFAGGWTLDAAEAICAGEDIDSYAVLDLTAQLVNKSLVQRMRQSQTGETRYHLLETIRQYAQEKLSETGNEEIYRHRHLAYFVKLTEEGEHKLYDANRAFWLQKLRDEIDNLRLALRWALATDPPSGLRLIIASWDFWLASDDVGELEGRLTQLLEQYRDEDILRARALVVYAHLLADIGDFAKSKQIATQSLALSRATFDKQTEAASLYRLGWISDNGSELVQQSIGLFQEVGDKRSQALAMTHLGQLTNDPEQTRAILLDALQLHRELGYAEGIAKCQTTLAGQFIWNGDYASARPLLEETLELYRQLGNVGGESNVSGMYGSIAYWQGDYEQAYVYYQKAVLLRENDGTYFSLWPRVGMAYALLRMGNIAKAKEQLGNSAQAFSRAGVLVGVVFSIEGFASLYVNQGQTKRAVQLLAWADAMREQNQNSRPSVEQRSVEKDMSLIFSQISGADFEEAYERGREMSVDQALALALADSEL